MFRSMNGDNAFFGNALAGHGGSLPKRALSEVERASGVKGFDDGPRHTLRFHLLIILTISYPV
jgi:hypothetical protein